MSLEDVEETEGGTYPTGIDALDAVLSGGLAEGSVTLLVGEPGIGKSTLLLQVGDSLCDVAKTLYVSSEEPLPRIKARARSLGGIARRLLVVWETDTHRLREAARMVRPDVLLIDSLHGLSASFLVGRPGSVQQAAHAAYTLRDLGYTVLASCHVTKDGGLAGPKDIEHLVDAVLWMEGDPSTPERTVRASKNRFGPTTVTGTVTRGGGGFR